MTLLGQQRNSPLILKNGCFKLTDATLTREITFFCIERANAFPGGDTIETIKI